MKLLFWEILCVVNSNSRAPCLWWHGTRKLWWVCCCCLVCCCWLEVGVGRVLGRVSARYRTSRLWQQTNPAFNEKVPERGLDLRLEYLARCNFIPDHSDVYATQNTSYGFLHTTFLPADTFIPAVLKSLTHLTFYGFLPSMRSVGPIWQQNRCQPVPELYVILCTGRDPSGNIRASPRDYDKMQEMKIQK